MVILIKAEAAAVSTITQFHHAVVATQYIAFEAIAHLVQIQAIRWSAELANNNVAYRGSQGLRMALMPIKEQLKA